MKRIKKANLRLGEGPADRNPTLFLLGGFVTCSKMTEAPGKSACCRRLLPSHRIVEEKKNR